MYDMTESFIEILSADKKERKYSVFSKFQYFQFQLSQKTESNTALPTPQIERLKAVFITDRGSYGYNFASGSSNSSSNHQPNPASLNQLTTTKLQAASQSRIEIISAEPITDIAAALKACLNNQTGSPDPI